MRVLGAFAPAGVAGRSVSNANYTYAHSITIDTLFDHDLHPHARPRRWCACGRRRGLNQITSADDGTSVLTPTYDARGNLTSYNGRTFGYDTYNRLTSVGGTGGSMTLGYDPLGRLWETSGPSGTARYQYDGAAIIAEYNASGVMQHRWVHGPGMDEPLVRYDGSGLTNKRWLHADERGSIIAHTNTGGSRIQTNRYDAYGNPGATNAGLFQYTGQVWLADAGVYYYKNRTYHAELSVFMQADPIGHSGGVNLYAYVGGDPVNSTDPSGECGTPISAGLGAAAGVLGGVAWGIFSEFVAAGAAGRDVDISAIRRNAIHGAIAGGVGGAVLGATCNPALLPATVAWTGVGYAGSLAGIGIANGVDRLDPPQRGRVTIIDIPTEDQDDRSLVDTPPVRGGGGGRGSYVGGGIGWGGGSIRLPRVTIIDRPSPDPDEDEEDEGEASGWIYQR